MIFLLLAMSLPDALLHRPYASGARWEPASARCPMPVIATRYVQGDLPPGMQVSVHGALEGTPTESGQYAFTIEIADGCTRRLEQREIRVMPAPMLIAEAETLEFQCMQGAPPFSGGIVRVSGSAPGRPYSVDIAFGNPSPKADWLRAEMRAGTLPMDGLALEADTVRLTIDPDRLAPGTYAARLRVSTWQGANTPELQFRLRVDSPLAIFGPNPGVPGPIPVRTQAVELPNVPLLVPPAVPRPAPPHFSRRKPNPAAKPQPAKHATPIPSRSRILPFPKVVIPPRGVERPVKTKTPPPVRTKPSAMSPTPHTATAKKPSPAH